MEDDPHGFFTSNKMERVFMKKETVQEKRANTCDEIDIAKGEVNYKEYQLRKNLEVINNILRTMKKRRKVISCLTYLKSNWKDGDYITDGLNTMKKSLRSYSTCYKIAILERKLLKNGLKQAQRKLAKKQKRIKDFDKKYFPKGD